jgi:hypothetical protein
MMLRQADVDRTRLKRVSELAGYTLRQVVAYPRVGHRRQVRAMLLGRADGHDGGNKS